MKELVRALAPGQCILTGAALVALIAAPQVDVRTLGIFAGLILLGFGAALLGADEVEVRRRRGSAEGRRV